MSDMVICPNCECEIEVTEVLSAQLRTQLQKEFETDIRKKEAAIADREREVARAKEEVTTAQQDIDRRVSEKLAKERKLLSEEALAKAREQVTVEIRDKGATAQQLYEHIFGFGYLSPFFTLRWAGKDVQQLSPGERGTLLLVFYLLIDRSDIPLIIDQPEENLDNQTVFNVLVPSIKEARARRQLIIVTHNPNLAVVCDADQVICASINREDGNKVTYESGAIENPSINKRILDILEGTRPAFDNRDSKYHPLPNAV